MARDYKNSTPRSSKQIPCWIWLLCGLVIGFFVALLFCLQSRPGTLREFAPQVHLHTPQKEQPAEQPQSASNPLRKNGSPRFDFFTLLPEMEVVIPAGNYHIETTETLNATDEKHAQYSLQAGSFRQFGQADKRKAQLALLGISANIQRVRVNDGYWHRVRVGPFADKAKMESTQQQLRLHSISSIAIKIAQDTTAQ